MAELRTAISRLGVLDIAETKLGAVHVDINDVLASTRSAANTILEAAEDLLAATQTGNDYRMLVEQRMFALMEACSFQDLTGQRLQRVTHTLQAMEERLRIFAGTVKVGHGTALSGEVGPDTVFQGEVERQRAARNDANMVHGPGGAGAIPQETVDWLFATTS
jgi:chemotaxis protein CheZ